MAGNYIWLFIYIYRAKKQLEKHVKSSVSKGPKHSRVKLARQLFSLVLVYFVCYTPLLGSAMYEWITHYYSPPINDVLAVLYHLASVANPILYLWTSTQAKKEIRRIFNNLCGTFSFESGTISSTKSTQSIQQPCTRNEEKVGDNDDSDDNISDVEVKELDATMEENNTKKAEKTVDDDGNNEDIESASESLVSSSSDSDSIV